MASALGEGEYLKFFICARRRREDSQERYFYEWGNIHVALMLTTPEVMQVFQRYAQHYSVSGVGGDSLIYPLSPMHWDNMADHWLKSHEDFILALTAEGYAQRMQPHRFGDHAFELALAKGATIFRRGNYRPGGGVKLIHWLRRRPHVSRAEFSARLLSDYGPAVVRAAGPSLMRKYVQNVQLDLERERFRGTLLEKGDVAQFDAVEEIWFDSLEHLAQLQSDRTIRRAITDAAHAFIDIEASFAMVTTERVVFDYASGESEFPPPSILDPASLEARVAMQGFSNWNRPAPSADLAAQRSVS